MGEHRIPDGIWPRIEYYLDQIYDIDSQSNGPYAKKILEIVKEKAE